MYRKHKFRKTKDVKDLSNRHRIGRDEIREIATKHIGQAHKDNFHLLAEIDGKERKFVIGKNKEEYALIEKTGIANLTADQLLAMGEKYFQL